MKNFILYKANFALIVLACCIFNLILYNLSVDKHQKFDFFISWNSSPTRVKIILPGHGSLERLEPLKRSLAALRRSCVAAGVGYHCLVYVYEPEHVAATEDALDFCEVQFHSGLWTDHMIQVPQPVESHLFFAASPKAPTHYLIMMDDIEATGVNLPMLISTMKTVDYQVASPSFPDWQTQSLLQRKGCLAHRTGHVDILFTVMTPAAWQCWQRGLDSQLNQFGWGYDLTFADVCDVRIGVIDHETAHHDPGNCPRGGNCKARTYNSTMARQQMDQYLMAAGVEVKTVEEADVYFKEVAFLRPHRFPYCDKVQLNLLSSRFYMSTTHRGGWKSIMQGLIREGRVTERKLKYDVSSYVHLVDCIEEWFLWEKRGRIHNDWIGVTHMLTRDLLPDHQSKDNLLVLDTYLDSPEFASSADSCAALLFFTNELLEAASKRLKVNGFHHIQTCLVRHPISVSGDVEQFNLTTDLPVILSNSSSVILLGQQYRRIASLHQLQTRRTKIWLPSRIDEEFINGRTQFELSVENVTFDPKVEVKRYESNEEYDVMVKQNIVVVDLWAAAANNAVMEAIALNAPFFIRRLPGPEEYLGKEYPLFFSSIKEFEALMEDNEALEKAIVEGHKYLVALPRRELSIAHFGKELENCALTALNHEKKMPGALPPGVRHAPGLPHPVKLQELGLMAKILSFIV